jgi:hypothetical protein
MRKSLVIILIALISCNEKTKPVAPKETLVIAVSADSIISKFKTSNCRRTKVENGIYNYIDTSFKGELFIVKDTITEIRVDNTGKGYIVLGKVKNNENVKCYFENKSTIDSLKPNQVITVSSSRHAAKAVTMIADTSIKVLVVELGFCQIIK